MIGVVLCGGESSRMGSDKGLLLNDVSTWAELAFNKLSTLKMPVVLSVNTQQIVFYKTLFPLQKLVIDDTQLLIGGPLHGLLSVHQIYPNDAILLLACDMPMMAVEVLEKLLQQHQTNPTKNAIFFIKDNQPEPLCTIYTSEAMAKILSLYNANKLSKYSMKYMLEQLDVLALEMPQNWQPFFKNYNSKNDLQTL